LPSHRVHRFIDRVFLGRAYPHVHIWMDEPAWTTSLGSRHRILRHDLLSLLARFGVSEEFISGLLHILADTADSEIKASKRRNSRRR
jgi:hypothetical protein